MSLDTFSATYAEARAKFRAAADAQSAAPEVYTSTLRGPSGEALCVDVAGLKLKGARKVLVIQSGTHGVEGFAGSACQITLLNEGIGRRLPEGVGLMMIHAINPYGFAYVRRVNEDNVDLNRNFIDFAAGLPKHEAYDLLADAIAPKAIDDASMKAANAVLKAYAQEHGAARLQAAISCGQYRDPQGLYFGGHRPTWSRITFEGIMARMPDSATEVVFVDLHTGLGPEGHGELISEEGPEAPGFQRARAYWGPSVKSTVTGESVSAQLTGTIDLGLQWILRGRHVTPVALEYGTLTSNIVFAALRYDNWLHAYGGHDHPDYGAIKARLKDAFFIDTDAWKTKVLARAREVIDQALAGMAS